MVVLLKSYRDFLSTSWALMQDQEVRYGENYEVWSRDDLEAALPNLTKMSADLSARFYAKGVEGGVDERIDLTGFEYYKSQIADVFSTHGLSFQ